VLQRRRPRLFEPPGGLLPGFDASCEDRWWGLAATRSPARTKLTESAAGKSRRTVTTFPGAISSASRLFRRHAQRGERK
jgi:hypothetical protein